MNFADDDLERWIGRQLRASLRHMAESISATGLTHERPEFYQTITPLRGSVLASPTIGPAAKPDYFFHWLRDSAVVMDALALAIERGDESRASLRHLRDFVAFSRAISRLDGPSRLEAQGVGATSDPELARYLRSEHELRSIVGDRALAEARIGPDATLDSLKWARPQYDGPALRAGTLLRRIALFEQDAPQEARALLRDDIAFTLAHFDEPCYDIWEYRFGHHYHTRVVCLGALTGVQALARDLGLEAEQPSLEFAHPSLEFAHPRLEAAIARLRRGLDHHWRAEEGFYLSAIKGTETSSDLDLDSAVILAVVEAGLASGRHSVLDPRVHATLARLEQLFEVEFPINAGLAPGEAPLIGRFRGDGYYGGGVFLFGALAAAELYYRLAGHIRVEGTLPADRDNRLFLERCGLSWLGSRGPLVALSDGEERRDSASRLRMRGDSILRALARRLPEDGEMPEQLDKATGAPASARNLAWSYAAFIGAVAAREAALAEH